MCNLILDISIPMVLNNEGRWDYSSCSMYANASSSGDEHVLSSSNESVIVPCRDGWTFHYDSEYASSVVSEVSCVEHFGHLSRTQS